jgi:DNA invertase Pin-like site-specific DNA recombinase
MLESLAANAGQVQAVVIERMDRLARDLMASEFLLRELRKLNVKLFSTDQNNLEDVASNDVDPTRILIRQILGALAQWEKTTLVKKLRVAAQRAAKEGRVGGNKPFGAKEGEQEGLRQLAEWSRQGYKTQDISDMLNARNYPTRSGKPWSRHTVHGILSRTGQLTSEVIGAKAVRKELANLLANSDS